MPSAPIVVKVGGSLFDLPDLGPQLGQWLTTLGTGEVLLLPGGGPTADVIRDLDRTHGLGEEVAHWLALQALSLNAHFLAHLLTPFAQPAVVEEPGACDSLWRCGKLPILDAHRFARADEGRPGCLPHRWSVTSDSLAARVAVFTGASQLILLKAATLPEGIDWTEAGRRGFVDVCFAEVLRSAECGMRNAECAVVNSALRTPHSALRAIAVRAVNLREWPARPLADGPSRAP
jgi:aspartokinase-like uncharacterized kinase